MMDLAADERRWRGVTASVAAEASGEASERGVVAASVC